MREELLEKIAEILEVEKIGEKDTLESFDEWDSLTSLSLIALVDSDFNVTLTNDDIKMFEIVKDVIDFVEKEV